jgi:hypothetical protein
MEFVIHALPVMKRLASAEGVFGYTLLARPRAEKFRTLSAWESHDAREGFVEEPPQVRTMSALSPHMQKTAFLRSSVKSADLPPPDRGPLAGLRRWPVSSLAPPGSPVSFSWPNSGIRIHAALLSTKRRVCF